MRHKNIKDQDDMLSWQTVWVPPLEPEPSHFIAKFIVCVVISGSLLLAWSFYA